MSLILQLLCTYAILVCVVDADSPSTGLPNLYYRNEAERNQVKDIPNEGTDPAKPTDIPNEGTDPAKPTATDPAKEEQKDIPNEGTDPAKPTDIPTGGTDPAKPTAAEPAKEELKVEEPKEEKKVENEGGSVIPIGGDDEDASFPISDEDGEEGLSDEDEPDEDEEDEEDEGKSSGGFLSTLLGGPAKLLQDAHKAWEGMTFKVAPLGTLMFPKNKKKSNSKSKRKNKNKRKNENEDEDEEEDEDEDEIEDTSEEPLYKFKLPLGPTISFPKFKVTTLGSALRGDYRR